MKKGSFKQAVNILKLNALKKDKDLFLFPIIEHNALYRISHKSLSASDRLSVYV